MLYEGDTLQLAADDDAPSLDPSVFDAVADLIYKAGGFDINQVKDPAARKMMIETAAAINRGVNTHLPTDVPDTLRYALEENSFIFSGFKTFHAMREIGLSLLNDKGEIKQYADFQADVIKLNNKYNKAYLYAEYKHAISTSQMAAKWVGIEADGDRYLLQYRTAEDNRVREDHAALDGITLPPSDPFWSKYYPPNGWGCRCTAVQVRRGKYTESDPKAAMELGDSATEAAKQQIFRFNAGKEMQLFPPKHPYFKAPAAAKKVVQEVVQEESEQVRKDRYKAELPDSLTDAEKEAIVQNYIDIEKAAKIRKGVPMSLDDADKQSANPKHVLQFIEDPNGTYRDKAGKRYKLNPDYKKSRDERYSINCATCSPAYALRLRGFNVTAKGCVERSGSRNEWAMNGHSFDMWTNADGTPAKPAYTYEWKEKKGYKTMTEKRYHEYFEEVTKEEGVYILTIGWKGRGGHATILQRFADGTLAYIEPQEYNGTAAKRDIDELCKKGAGNPHPKRGVLRVDNKIFNAGYMDLFDTE